MNKLSVCICVVIFCYALGSRAAISLQEPSKNFIETGTRATLDRVKVIRHVHSGRCLIIENGKRQGSTREHQLVLWKCHDRSIRGLEQEMFSLIKSNGGGYLLMGNAGSLDKCMAAERNYNDLVMIHTCNPNKEDQSWYFRRAHHLRDTYQVVHMSTGRCVRAPGDHDGAWIRVGDCDLSDERQFWQVCGLDGSCDF